MAASAGGNSVWLRTAATTTPGSEARAVEPRTAYSSVRLARAVQIPVAWNNQPIGSVGVRDVRMAPTMANPATPTEIEMMKGRSPLDVAGLPAVKASAAAANRRVTTASVRER
jgi:hypothetical protein